MGKNWAIVIGVNNYESLPRLKYAKRDAELMRDFLIKQAKFDRVYLFSDDSPDYEGNSTKPTLVNLRRVLRQLFNQPCLSQGDNFWFFFSGHGTRYQDQDYLMPIDADPGDIGHTGIATQYISDRLSRCGADNVVLVLDACRNQGGKALPSMGSSTALLAGQKGIISLFSCSPGQLSYEVDALKQGVFTHVLLQALGNVGRCATVEQLNQYMKSHVPKLLYHHHKHSGQTSYTRVEPIERAHLILMPQYAKPDDIEALNQSALRSDDSALAEQLQSRAIAAAAILNQAPSAKSFSRRRLIRLMGFAASGIGLGTVTAVFNRPSPSSTPNDTPSGGATPQPDRSSAASATFSPFSFKVVTVDAQGQISEPQQQQAQHFVQDLGGVALEMVVIPGGKFEMGSTASAATSPVHAVEVPTFAMGKYAVTQAQWQAIARLNAVGRTLEENPSKFKGGNRPVEQISWLEADEFCKRLSHYIGQNSRRTYRLPSEAEWEYACRAGTITSFHFGETLTPQLANYGMNRLETTPVGSFGVANAFGLYDMHGNVWEYCADYWFDNYSNALSNGDARLDKPDPRRIIRGGSWLNNMNRCQSTYRDSYGENLKDWSFNLWGGSTVGIRVVCALG
ncbi:MAG: SUMF1/EgtB/PvdO family nonheme iron enzyme [Drouetiella hepatica Uher 2000/2452]|jgi:formylglycine-generating enzyme required for sulfatase activity/uncharacterized caspase-like protein|uniref:SUMF1/EgtB/PvdO family nonheme iron enzyme n=1 Tax=Drouetiella hepatica Uher 2000/2452 TaxID=904376 RepID=A0A951QCV9_9CYAN|nr:SUMF1/EgtB/PvdO family nonheme iron enzyme [Drouetiella hepatica Uher 2000/2452]